MAATRTAAVAVLLAGVLILGPLLWPPSLWAADSAGSLSLSDGRGQHWAVSLFQQPDPAYPRGARLRVTALAPHPHPAQAPSHTAPLELSDAFGGSWALPNRSQELVPPQVETLPPSSAQFGLDGVTSRLRSDGPLVLHIPLAGEEPARVVLGPAPSAALRDLVEHG
ncbi:MAG: DUF3122 domain-containing protein [Cyanobacteria bacterium J06638_7]